MRNQIYFSILLILLVFCTAPVDVDAQCAMCNATAATSNEGNNEGALSLNSGILFLMAIPYLLLMGILIVWLYFRKQKKAEETARLKS